MHGVDNEYLSYSLHFAEHIDENDALSSGPISLQDPELRIQVRDLSQIKNTCSRYLQTKSRFSRE